MKKHRKKWITSCNESESLIGQRRINARDAVSSLVGTQRSEDEERSGEEE